MNTPYATVIEKTLTVSFSKNDNSTHSITYVDADPERHRIFSEYDCTLTQKDARECLDAWIARQNVIVIKDIELLDNE
jgi:hypothetical protein